MILPSAVKQTVPEAIMAQVVDGLIPASSSLSATGQILNPN